MPCRLELGPLKEKLIKGVKKGLGKEDDDDYGDSEDGDVDDDADYDENEDD